VLLFNSEISKILIATFQDFRSVTWLLTDVRFSNPSVLILLPVAYITGR